MSSYLITDHHGRDEHGRLWDRHVSHTVFGEGEVWDKGWIRTFEHPFIAAMMNPVSMDELAPLLWLCDTFGAPKLNHNINIGWVRVKTLRKLSWPFVTAWERMKFAVLCVNQTTDAEDWKDWTERWLDGDDTVIWPDDGIEFAVVKSATTKSLDLVALAHEAMGY